MGVKKKLLVTGAGGFLGWNICRAALAEWEVIGVSRSRPIALDGVTTIQGDLTDFAFVKQLFATAKPDAIIHAAAEPAPNVCQEHPLETKKINVDAGVTIAGFANEYALPVAMVSTDLVFDGTKPPYSETDPVCPISVYGEQKVAAEIGMKAMHDKVAICRIPLEYGDAPPRAQSFIQPMIKALIEQSPLSLFADEMRTPSCAASTAKGLLLALSHAPTPRP